MSKILIIKLGALGDMILASAAFAGLKKRFPTSRFTLLTTPTYLPLVKNCPYFSQFLLFNRGAPFLPQTLRLRKEIKKEGFQLVVNLQNNWKSTAIAAFSGAAERVGFRKGVAGFFLTKSVGYNQNQSALWNLKQVLTLLETEPAEKLELYITPKQKEEAKILLTESGWNGKPLVGFHPGASPEWQSKRWPAEYWAKLAEIISQKGMVVALFGDQPETEVIARMPKPFCNLTSRLPLSLLPAAISLCSAFVSTDSGPLFIAAAAGIKTIGLYGPTDPNRHAPPAITALFQNLPCQPCHQKYCPKPICLSAIEPATVARLLG